MFKTVFATRGDSGLGNVHSEYCGVKLISLHVPCRFRGALCVTGAGERAFWLVHIGFVAHCTRYRCPQRSVSIDCVVLLSVGVHEVDRRRFAVYG